MAKILNFMVCISYQKIFKNSILKMSKEHGQSDYGKKYKWVLNDTKMHIVTLRYISSQLSDKLTQKV